MRDRLSAAELIEQKYKEDGADVVQTYQALRFDKHVRLMRDRLGLRPGTTVLDVGCGTGARGAELACGGAKVVGVDTFQEAGGIDKLIAKARLHESGAAAALAAASTVALPFRDDSFQLVVNIGMLEHLPPEIRGRALQEMFRVVAPRGHLFLIAGPTRATPFDQHVPGHPFGNWLARERKKQYSERAGRRQFLELPWGISRSELKRALPAARFNSLYGAFFALESTRPLGRFQPTPLWLLAWAKRHLHLNALFGALAHALYIVRQEHCHILAIEKTCAAIDG